MKDMYGNELYDMETKRGFDYYIRLVGEGKSRKLGTLKSKGVFEIKRDREKHLFEKLRAYGFNEFLIRVVLQPEIKIVVKEKGRQKKLETSIKNILDKGQYLQFLSHGLERQIFLSLTDFENA